MTVRSLSFPQAPVTKKFIYVILMDITQNNRRITLSPAWSSDGKWLAFTSYTKGKPDIYIKHLTENRGSVIAKKGINISPAWVPGEFLLAATLSFSGDPEIYLLTGTGEMVKRLTRKRGIDVSPTFSPNGKQMAFVSKRSGTPQIYIKDLDSGKVKRLTFEGRYNTQPSWSPKGDKIIYSGMKQGFSDIFVIGVLVTGWQPYCVQLDTRRPLQNLCYDRVWNRPKALDCHSWRANRTTMVAKVVGQ